VRAELPEISSESSLPSSIPIAALPRLTEPGLFLRFPSGRELPLEVTRDGRLVRVPPAATRAGTSQRDCPYQS